MLCPFFLDHNTVPRDAAASQERSGGGVARPSTVWTGHPEEGQEPDAKGLATAPRGRPLTGPAAAAQLSTLRPRATAWASGAHGPVYGRAEATDGLKGQGKGLSITATPKAGGHLTITAEAGVEVPRPPRCTTAWSRLALLTIR